MEAQEVSKDSTTPNISLQVPGDLYRWSATHWYLQASGQVSISSGMVSILTDKGPVYEFPIGPDPLCVLKAHAGSDRGWSFTAKVGETEERLALRFNRQDTAKKVKDVITSQKPNPASSVPLS